MHIGRAALPFGSLLVWLFSVATLTAIAEPRASEIAAGTNPPPAESRILKIIHSWPDNPSAQDALITSLKTQGFGGVVCNVSFGDYLVSDTKWQALARAVAEAKKVGFALWLYDEKGYPSGTAGGLVLRDHPEWEARGLLIAQTETRGGPVSMDVPPGLPFLTAAFPMGTDGIDAGLSTNLAANVRDGKLSWQAPPGHWQVMAITESRLFDGTHASMSLSEHIPYPNLLEPEPTARFLELTHGAYARHLGQNLGRYFVSTFTDEPSLMSLFLRPMPYRVLPWSAKLPAEFKRRRGRPLEPLVPLLVVDGGLESRRARYDFWRTVGELVSENCFGQIQQWCAAHHVASGGHLLMEENLVNQVALYGDFFQCLQRLDAPGIDCLTSIPEQVPWFIARLAGSAADLGNKPLTMCETSDHSQRYRPAGDRRPVRNVSEEEIRGTCNRLVVSGIDTITSYYSFAGLADEPLRRLNQWVGCCCSSLKGGHQVADVAVLYPVESVWPKFVPSRHYANDAAAAVPIETTFHDVSDSLFAAGRNFTYVDGRALAEARVERGSLVHGQLRWRVVILPAADTLPLKAWETLAEFVRSGGVLIAAGARPANSETEFPSARVQNLADELFGKGPDQQAIMDVATNKGDGAGVFLGSGMTALLPRLLDRIVELDVKATGTNSPLRSTHRRINGQDIYFVINDSPQPWNGSITLAADGPGEAVDPATGRARSLADGRDINLSLSAYGGALFRFDGGRSPRRLKLKPGRALELAFQPLPVCEPQLAGGEFVSSELGPASSQTGVFQPRWSIRATLKKGQVDTYLFARFIYPDFVALKGADCVVLDTWVPQEQRTPAQLLLILHEKNGADYLALTGRSLNEAGYAQTWVPFSRFQLAGWSNDPKGYFDPESVTEIRVGWGGYLATQGEKIHFELGPLRIASVAQN